MTVLDEPKVDCHVHLLDPDRFPYSPTAQYAPPPHERADAQYLTALFDSHGVRHALLVGPNSGYDTDNSCLLDFLDRGAGRFKGVAVVDQGIGADELVELRRRHVVGVTMQMAMLGVPHFAGAGELLRHLAELDMFVDVQVQDDQLVSAAPLLDAAGGRVLIDHCGRPDPRAGLGQPGFRQLLRQAETGRYFVKLSGLVKASQEPFPYRDAWPFVRELVAAYGPDRCLWGSDWPFLRAPQRLDHGPLQQLFAELVPDPELRRRIWWDTPRRLFGFDGPAG